jgi:predicted enzyme related to lactoylglutathione lyase
MILGLEFGGRKEDKKGVSDICLRVDNLDDAFRELKNRGAEFLTEPTDQDQGTRTAKFIDPDDNAFILVQLKK